MTGCRSSGAPGLVPFDRTPPDGQTVWPGVISVVGEGYFDMVGMELHLHLHSRSLDTARAFDDVFRYAADVRGFIGDEVFETNHVEGTIPRRWV